MLHDAFPQRLSAFPLSGSSPHIALLGAGGLLGSAIVRQARARGWSLSAASSREIDARDERQVAGWLRANRPDVLVVCAARNAGVHVNIASPADMLGENARIAIASIGAARSLSVPRLLYCSSSAIYPPDAPLPSREIDAGNGPMEASHSGYSAAKLLGTRFCQAIRKQDGLDYTALLLTNIYGPGQSYDPSRANVVASLLARFHQAKLEKQPDVVVWGTGNATRDLIYVEDAAGAILMLTATKGPDDATINIATGREISIRDLAESVSTAVGYYGAVTFDPAKPEGARRKVMEISRLAALGWQAKRSLTENLRSTYETYLELTR